MRTISVPVGTVVRGSAAPKFQEIPLDPKLLEKPLCILYSRTATLISHEGHRVTWRTATYQDLFPFPATYPVREYAKAWDARIQTPNGLTFFRLREEMRKVAVDNWSTIPGVIIVNDYQTLVSLVTVLPPAWFIIPIDEDDWISPGIVEQFQNPALLKSPLVAWLDVLWWVRLDGKEIQENWGIQNTFRMLGSNAYAITPAKFFSIPDGVRKTVLDQHWKVLQLGIFTYDDIRFLDTSPTIGVKYPGCTSTLLEQVAKPYFWIEYRQDYPCPTWAVEFCASVLRLHRQLISDMGGSFPQEELLSEIKT